MLRVGGRLVGAVRGRHEGDDWDIGRIMVAPDLQGRGIGRLLLTAIEQAAPAEVTGYVLFTGARSERNIRMYKKAGYRLRGEEAGVPGRRTPDQASPPSSPQESTNPSKLTPRKAARRSACSVRSGSGRHAFTARRSFLPEARGRQVPRIS